MKKLQAVFIVLLILPIAGSLEFPIENVTDMTILDMGDGLFYYVFACHKIVSDPFDRAGIYILDKDGNLKWQYHLSAVVKSITAYDLNADGKKEIIAACEMEADGSGYVYVFDIFEEDNEYQWRAPVPGTPKLLYCYDSYVAAFAYGEGERIMIFDRDGEKVDDLPVEGDLSNFEIRDVNNDGKNELIVSGIVNNNWEHFLVVYDMEEEDPEKRVLWNYQTWEHINDFEFYDIDNDGTQETILGVYSYLEVIRGGESLWKLDFPPPILHVEVVNEQILVANLNTLFLSDFWREALSKLSMDVKPEFLFLIDIDTDGFDEILVANGKTDPRIVELSDISEPVEEVPTVPLEEAEEVPEEIVYLVSICEAQLDVVIEDIENLNEEWVRICNDGDTDIDMSGWVLMNDVGIFYEFPYDFILKVGASVTVYTGSGEDTETELYWGSSAEVWNNAGDVVTLQDSAGNTIVEYIYPE